VLKQNILLIDLCKEKLHYFEFVKPIEDILNALGIKFFVKKYNQIQGGDLNKASKVIICGTSLKDNTFSNLANLKYFNWLRVFNRPVLGICGGMQIIGLILSANEKKLTQKTQIGFYYENFGKNFLGLTGKQEVYHLHNYFFNFPKKDFNSYCSSSGVNQAVKYRTRKIYGVLFHPEVRQKGLISNFCNL